MKNVRIVLVEPSHPGNIGAAARAMKNMGLSALYLVQPERFPDKQATIRASGADDILASAVVTETLAEALVGCELVYGTSARSRSLPWQVVYPRACAEDIVQNAASAAIVFGREEAGLTNAELAQCQRHVTIPTNPAFSSLNLGAAVQVLAYELKLATLAAPCDQPPPDSEYASAEQVEGFFEHLQTTMVEIGFLDMRQPKLLMQRMRRLFHRARLEKTELNILRGLLSTVQRKLVD